MYVAQVIGTVRSRNEKDTNRRNKVRPNESYRPKELQRKIAFMLTMLFRVVDSADYLRLLALDAAESFSS